MNYVITHTTVYEYSEAVTVSHHAARLKPRMTEVQDRQDFTLRILPEPSVWNRRTDYFGNRVAFFGIQEIHRRLEITAVSRVSVKRQTPPVPGLSPEWEQVADLNPIGVTPAEFAMGQQGSGIVAMALADGVIELLEPVSHGAGR